MGAKFQKLSALILIQRVQDKTWKTLTENENKGMFYIQFRVPAWYTMKVETS